MKHLLITIFITICLTSCAQNTYKGVIEDWDNKQAQIILPTEEPMIIGQVDATGHTTLKIDDAVTAALLSIKREENEQTGEITIVGRSVSNTFYCDPDQVTVSNGDIVPVKAAARGAFFVGNLKEEKIYGQLRLVSSKDFNDSYFTLGKKDFVKGYYFDFFYVPKPASVKGECKTETYTLDQKDTFYNTVIYDIELETGWNLVKIEVVDTYIDQEGNVRPLVTKMKTVKEIPADTQFVLSD